jgi:hypothetical protein
MGRRHDKRLGLRLTVDKDPTVADLDDVARHADDPLDEITTRIVGKPEDHDIPPLGTVKDEETTVRSTRCVAGHNALNESRRKRPINCFVDQEKLTVVESRLHATPLDLKILDDRLNDEKYDQSEDQCLEDIPDD